MSKYPCHEPGKEQDYTWSTNVFMNPGTNEVIKVISHPNNNFCNACSSFVHCQEKVKKETLLLLGSSEKGVPCRQTSDESFNWLLIDGSVEPVNNQCEECALVSVCTLEATRQLIGEDDDGEEQNTVINSPTRLN